MQFRKPRTKLSSNKLHRIPLDFIRTQNYSTSQHPKHTPLHRSSTPSIPIVQLLKESRKKRVKPVAFQQIRTQIQNKQPDIVRRYNNIMMSLQKRISHFNDFMEDNKSRQISFQQCSQLLQKYSTILQNDQQVLMRIIEPFKTGHNVDFCSLLKRLAEFKIKMREDSSIEGYQVINGKPDLSRFDYHQLKQRIKASRPVKQLITRIYPTVEEFEKNFYLQNSSTITMDKLASKVQFFLQHFDNKCSRKQLNSFIQLFQYNKKCQTKLDNIKQYLYNGSQQIYETRIACRQREPTQNNMQTRKHTKIQIQNSGRQRPVSYSLPFMPCREMAVSRKRILKDIEDKRRIEKERAKNNRSGCYSCCQNKAIKSD